MLEELIDVKVEIVMYMDVPMTEFLGSLLTPFLPLVQNLFTDPLLLKSECHGTPPPPKFGHHLWMFPYRCNWTYYM